MRKVDAAVIGFGKGGKALAGALAAAGKTVALVEKSPKRYGGTCINVACIPTKSLVHSAALSAAQGGTNVEVVDGTASFVNSFPPCTGAASRTAAPVFAAPGELALDTPREENYCYHHKL